MKLSRTVMVTLTSFALSLGIAMALPSVTFGEDSLALEQESETNDASSEAATSASGEENLGDQDTVLEETVTVGEVEEIPSVSTSQPETSAAATKTEPQTFDVIYIDENCEEQEARECKPLKSTDKLLTAGWYVLRENVTLDHELEIEGNVRIVLAGKHTLTANKGIRTKKDATLTLYAEKDHPGKIVVHKGIVRRLTKEQQEEENEWLAEQLEADPDFKYVKPQILFVWPCLGVTAGDHAPWPADAKEPDPDPDHAPKKVKKPTLNEALLSKAYLVIAPHTEHSMLKDGDELVYEDEHFTCTECDCWFEDAEGKVRLDKTAVSALLVVQSEESSSVTTEGDSTQVTITFDANGGSGSMDSMVVTSGEVFELPECTFTAPEGKEFSSWSLGKAGSKVSVPSDTTVRAWWKNVSTVNTSSSTETSSTTGGSSTANQSSASSSSSSQSTQSKSSSTSESSSPSTGDALATANAVAVILLLFGSSFLFEAQSRRSGDGN